MWQESWSRVRTGDITCDPRLADKASDKRRGLTLIARLEPSVTERLGNMLKTLSGIESHQYYYPLEDIHLTILSLFTATENYGLHLERLDDYRNAVARALKSSRSFIVDSVGITLSRGAVMLQGFPRDATLNDLRDHLRSALVRSDLGDSLDHGITWLLHIQLCYVLPVRYECQSRFAQLLAPFEVNFLAHRLLRLWSLCLTTGTCLRKTW